MTDWKTVDGYFAETLNNEPEWLAKVRAANAAADIMDIAVSVQQGALLGLLVKAMGAKRILEVGTLGGYSALWMAHMAGEGAHITTLEADPGNAAQARRNIEAVGLSDRIEIVEGDARETIGSVAGPIDFGFFDADKKSNAFYLKAALNIARPGALLIVDNVVRDGNLVDASKTDENSQGAREVIAAAGAEGRLMPVGLQTVGEKGWDGMLLCLVTG